MDLKKGLLGSAIAGAGALRVASVAAQDTAAAGNGGTADASASGGAVGIGDINSGGNTGGSAATGNVYDGAVAIDTGDVTSDLSLGISADGGVAISDASGGDGNFAFVS
jgi:hypothetical protein